MRGAWIRGNRCETASRYTKLNELKATIDNSAPQINMKYPEDFINQIICGDCLEVMKFIPDESIDLVLTDPPYGINHKKQEWDKINKKDIFKIYEILFKKLKNGGRIISFINKDWLCDLLNKKWSLFIVIKAFSQFRK